MRIDGKRASEFSNKELATMVVAGVSPGCTSLSMQQRDEAHKVLKLREAKKEVK